MLRALAQFPVVTGIGIALIEIGVGLGTLLAIAPVTAAAIGLAVNLVLFLSATWHVHPYFLGSDSMYAVAWLAYRRELLRGGVLAAAALFLAAAAKAVAGSPTTVAPSRAATGGTGVGANPGSSPAATGPAAGKAVASLDSVPVGGAIGFTAPGGFPAVLLRPSQDRVVAYSRVCTHAGCLVQFDQQADVLICPCHGAEFDPTRGAAVLAGPAPSPLRSIPVAIDQASGKVVATG